MACADADGDGTSDSSTCADLVPWAENALAFKAASLQVGREGTGSRAGHYFPGLVDDVWTFQGALSDAQVEKLAGQLVRRTHPGSGRLTVSIRGAGPWLGAPFLSRESARARRRGRAHPSNRKDPEMHGIRRPRRPVKLLRRRIALGVSTAMVATLIQAVAFAPAAGAAGKGRPGLTDPDKPVAGKNLADAEPRKVQKGPKTPQKAPKATWPEADAAVVTLAEPTSKASSPVRAKGLPLRLNTPSTKQAKKPLDGKVTTRVLSQKAATEGRCRRAAVHP